MNTDLRDGIGQLLPDTRREQCNTFEVSDGADTGEDRWMPESRRIVAYLRQIYG